MLQKIQKHVLFRCQKGKEVWGKLGLYEVISKVCVVDHAGEAVLEFLLFMQDRELSLMGIQNMPELIGGIDVN